MVVQNAIHAGPMSNTVGQRRASFQINFLVCLYRVDWLRQHCFYFTQKWRWPKCLLGNYRSLCSSSIAVRSINSISWQIEVALIRKLRFQQLWGWDAKWHIKEPLVWAEPGGGLMAKGEAHLTSRKESQMKTEPERSRSPSTPDKW